MWELAVRLGKDYDNAPKSAVTKVSQNRAVWLTFSTILGVNPRTVDGKAADQPKAVDGLSLLLVLRNIFIVAGTRLHLLCFSQIPSLSFRPRRRHTRDVSGS